MQSHRGSTQQVQAPPQPRWRGLTLPKLRLWRVKLRLGRVKSPCDREKCLEIEYYGCALQSSFSFCHRFNHHVAA